MIETQQKKDFMKVFNSLCISRQAWQAWMDWISAAACSISIAADRTDRDAWEKRAEEFRHAMRNLGDELKAQEMFDILVDALEKNPYQDFLGELYMELGLGSHWHGQFFTPISLCRMMADMTIGKSIDALDEKGWISVVDPACGAGATLIAAAGAYRMRDINYQKRILFAGQDIDRVTAQMCYIQLSLLGCAGYVIVGNTLIDPMTGPILIPDRKKEQELWYTPMLLIDEVWQFRRMVQQCDLQISKAGKKVMQPTEGRMFIFTFDEKEVCNAG